MYNPAPSSGPSSLEERLAWMHEPVRLTPGHLPWLARKMLEAALYCFFCSLEKAILALVELHRQGKLEPWPEAEEQDAPSPRVSKYKAKLNPAAPMCRAGATHGQILPEATAQAGCEDSVASAAAVELGYEDAVTQVVLELGCEEAVAVTVVELGAVRRTLGPAVQHRAAIGPQMRPLRGASFSRDDRCRSAMVCRAAGQRRETCAQIVPIIQR